MVKIIRLKEKDLYSIVSRVIKEEHIIKEHVVFSSDRKDWSTISNVIPGDVLVPNQCFLDVGTKKSEVCIWHKSLKGEHDTYYDSYKIIENPTGTTPYVKTGERKDYDSKYKNLKVKSFDPKTKIVILDNGIKIGPE